MAFTSYQQLWISLYLIQCSKTLVWYFI